MDSFERSPELYDYDEDINFFEWRGSLPMPVMDNDEKAAMENIDRLWQTYSSMFPDDPDNSITWHMYEEDVTDANRIAALEWAIANKKHYWEYPDIHPELVPGYWEQWHKDHPGALI